MLVANRAVFAGMHATSRQTQSTPLNPAKILSIAHPFPVPRSPTAIGALRDTLKRTMERPRQPSLSIAPSLHRYDTTLKAYLASNPHVHRLVASNLVFHNDRLLVIQRSGADFSAGRWEFPGGSVDAADASILAGAARELREETGLRATGFVRAAGTGTRFTTGDGARTVHWLKVTFEVDVAPPAAAEGVLPVTLDPAEHMDYRWATEAEIRERVIDGARITFLSEEARTTMLEGFMLRRGG